jgi:hypothetical protein
VDFFVNPHGTRRLQYLDSLKRIPVKMKHFLNSMFVVVAIGAASVAVAQSGSGDTWQPDFNEDRLLSMPDLLPLLGHFGSQWGTYGDDQAGEMSGPNVVELNWSGQESEPLKLPYDADIVILTPGINDLSDPDQRTVSIRHILVESYVVNDGTEASAVEVHSAMPMKQQVLFMNQGQDANGRTMPYGARYILHLPDGSTAEVSTNSMGSMSMSGRPLRTMASLFHAGGQVYFAQ